MKYIAEKSQCNFFESMDKIDILAHTLNKGEITGIKKECIATRPKEMQRYYESLYA